MELKEYFKGKIFQLISETADELGLECYVVGGYVRDIFLNRPSKDIDVVVVGSGIEIAQAFGKKLGKGAHVSVFRNFGTAQVKYHDTEVEFVGARKESYSHDSRKPVVENGTLEDDQNRRDFTINAMAVCLNQARFGELVDPFGGLDDLKERTIRTPLDPDITFSDDPLRMMRCIRFATQLNFYIEDETFFALERNKERIGIISRERIADELNKILLSPVPSKGFVELDRCGLLPLIFPEMAALQGIETKNGRAHKDNFYHTLEVVDNIAKQTDNLWLRWATLLHDIGKPRTKRWEPKAGWTFHNHNYIGEKMIPDIFRKMKLPMNEKMKYVQKLVGLHMRPIVIADEEVTDSAVRRLLFEAGDDIDDLMLLCEADITSKNEVKKQRFLDNFKLVRQKLKDLEEKDRIRNFQPPVDGAEIMEVFGLAPCREVGSLKSAIKDAILDGVIPNEHDAAFAFMLEKAKKIGLKPLQQKETISINNIEKLVSDKENNQIEFKETTGQLERGMETLCAFLNGSGGTVLFGVTDKGKIIGQELSDKTKRDIVEATKRIEPLAEISISYVSVPNTSKHIIVLHVEPHIATRPFIYKGRAYCRMESVTSIMLQENYNSLLLQRGGKYGWEAMTNADLKIDKLDENAILGAVRKGVESGRLPETTIRESIPVILEKFNLTSNNGLLKNAAAVLFGKDMSDYPQCLLRMARFKGTDKEEFIDNQRTSGNLFQLLDAAMAFFFKHLSLSGKIEGLYRDEELAIPYKALRECCINALAHRIYHKPGSSVSIAIYDDRIEITNSGTFPADMTIERLLQTHDSEPTNPIIANVLYKSKVLESWGRGIALMLNESQRVGLPAPQFHTDGSFVWVIFPYKKDAKNEHPTSTPQVPHKYPASTPQVKAIVSTIGLKTLAVKEIMELMGLKDRKSFLHGYLTPAIEIGYVESIFPDSPKHPKQKYRLTEKGEELLL